MIEEALRIIRLEEGWRSVPYYCTEGYPTIGWGFKIGKKGDPLPNFTMRRDVGDFQLRQLVSELSEYVKDMQINDAQKAVLISMIYQMGWSGVRAFKNMWKAIDEGDIEKAAEEMLDSKWAREDTPSRAKRHALWFRIGVIT